MYQKIINLYKKILNQPINSQGPHANVADLVARPKWFAPMEIYCLVLLNHLVTHLWSSKIFETLNG